MTQSAPICDTCTRTSSQLAEMATGCWECSHVDCPLRKPVTASPPESGAAALGEASGCWRMRPVFPEY